jgi:hypothetical protein
MGAWGAGSFENDDAVDWLAEFCSEPGISVMLEALSVITDADEDEYLELPESCIGIAAAELVAALNGAPVSDLPHDAHECGGPRRQCGRGPRSLRTNGGRTGQARFRAQGAVGGVRRSG